VPQYPAQQPVLFYANIVIGQLEAVGRGAGGFAGTVVTPFGTAGVSLDSGQPYSYQSQAAPSEQPSLINFLGEETSRTAGGLLESVTTGANTVYSALWEVPVSGTGPITYLGYFAFNGATGELDYTAGVPVPTLSISQNATSVIVSWPNTGTFTLQQNTDETASGSWPTCSAPVTLANGTNSVTITIQPTGNLYFRLAAICP
jgi:hypothetical protein